MLLPNKFKKAGWIILVISLIAGILFLAGNAPAFLNAKVFSIFNEDAANGFSGIIENNITDELISVFIIIGGLIVAFSREKEEDEGISRLRVNSLIWAIVVNYTILLIAVVFIYDLSFVAIMMYNMFTSLLLFILKFNLTLKFKFKPDLE